MPHQCTRCGHVYPDAAEEILKGCNCGSRFFYYIRQEKLDLLKREIKEVMNELEKADKDQIEKDIRELTGIKEADEPVILDLESVRVIKPGKFEIDIVNLFSKNRPLIYKLGEGKYVIDLASSLKIDPKYKKRRENLDLERLSENKKLSRKDEKEDEDDKELEIIHKEEINENEFSKEINKESEESDLEDGGAEIVDNKDKNSEKNEEDKNSEIILK